MDAHTATSEISDERSAYVDSTLTCTSLRCLCDDNCLCNTAYTQYARMAQMTGYIAKSEPYMIAIRIRAAFCFGTVKTAQNQLRNPQLRRFLVPFRYCHSCYLMESERSNHSGRDTGSCVHIVAVTTP